MRVAAICTSVTLALVPTSTAVAEVEFGKVVAYKGICEPSGAIAFPAGTIDQVFIVANDETNGLKAYRAAGGDPLDMPSGDLNKFLGLNDEEEDNKADFEGATWLNDRAYWIGSHSRSRKGNIRHPRWQLFATRVSAASGAPTIAPTSEQAFNGLLPALSAKNCDHGQRSSPDPSENGCDHKQRHGEPEQADQDMFERKDLHPPALAGLGAGIEAACEEPVSSASWTSRRNR